MFVGRLSFPCEDLFDGPFLTLGGRAVTHGFLSDDRVLAWSNLILQRLMLHEIEVYGPDGNRPK